MIVVIMMITTKTVNKSNQVKSNPVKSNQKLHTKQSTISINDYKSIYTIPPNSSTEIIIMILR